MTLDDLERQNRGFYDFFGNFGLRYISRAISSKSINMAKVRTKFSALNVDFDGSSFDFLGSRKPAHEGIKKRYPRKSRYFTVVSQLQI